MNIRTRRAGTPPGTLRSRLGSGERTGVRESIYESEIQESRKSRKTDVIGAIERMASDTDALVYSEECSVALAWVDRP
jgi:hypothetical protein